MQRKQLELGATVKGKQPQDNSDVSIEEIKDVEPEERDDDVWFKPNVAARARQAIEGEDYDPFNASRPNMGGSGIGGLPPIQGLPPIGQSRRI